MKIGILTYHSVCNFGANLQALSTYSYLKNNGFKAIFINWLPSDLENLYKKNVNPLQYTCHQEFVKNFLPTTELCRNTFDIQRVIKKEGIKAVVIGSDAVFSYIPFLKRIHPSRKTLIGITKVSTDHKFPNPFWGEFKKSNDDIKIFAMSASAQFFDFNKCLPLTKVAIKKALSKFSIITARDRWTQRIISNLSNQNIEITPDPVFAFNQNVTCQYDKDEIISKYNLPNKYVIFSFCKQLYDKKWYSELYHSFQKEGFEIVNLTMPEGCLDIPCDIKIATPLSPLEWYGIIKYSSGYVGQRMHPMIVAFHNIVPFYIFDHYAYKKGVLSSSKIYDLLERADFLSNYFNIKEKRIPSPNTILHQITNFDKEKAVDFNKLYYSLYQTMMQNITNLL